MNALPFIPPGLEAMNVLPFPGSPPFEMPWVIYSSPGSPEHKTAAWAEYQARGGQWAYEHWERVYEQNMVRARQAHELVNTYHEHLGWGEREVRLNVGGRTRILDIADVTQQRGIEYKTGYVYKSPENAQQIELDAKLVQDGWDMTWVIDGFASEPVREALTEAVSTIASDKCFGDNRIMDKILKREQFEYWLAHMDDALEAFFKELPDDIRQQLDYTSDSLDDLEAWILDTYPSTQSMLETDQAHIVDGIARYIGETFRKTLGGYWSIELDPDYAFYGLPVFYFKNGRGPVCPPTLATASASRRNGTYLRAVLEGG